MSDDQPPISFIEHLHPPDVNYQVLPERPPARRWIPTEEQRQQRERERRAQLAEADRKKRAWIEDGNETRQPPEYRGQVFDVADRDGVHPTAFPPLRGSPQEGLSDEFIAFQAHNQVTYATHPDYYCPVCTIRYNDRPGNRCGPCQGKLQAIDAHGRRKNRRVPSQTEYPT